MNAAILLSLILAVASVGEITGAEKKSTASDVEQKDDDKSSQAKQNLAKGIKLADAGMHIAAIEMFDLAIAFDANYPLALSRRAFSYASLEQHGKAIFDLKKAISCERVSNRQRGMLRLQLAMSYREIGQRGAAISELAIAIDSSPQDCEYMQELRLARALTYSAIDDFQSAIAEIELLENCLNSDSGLKSSDSIWLSFYNAHSMILYGASDFPGSLRLAKEGLEQYPDSMGLHIACVRSVIVAKAPSAEDTALALSSAKKLVAIKGEGHFKSQVLLAEAYIVHEDMEVAREILLNLQESTVVDSEKEMIRRIRKKYSLSNKEE